MAGDDTPLKGTDDGELTPASKADSTKEVNIDDPEVESIAQLEEKLNVDKKKTILKALSPKKSLKEIEEEVARNTAKYDADTMNGDPIAKKKPTSKEMNAASQKTKNANIAAANINPTNVTRLIRMFVIIALGAYKGELQNCLCFYSDRPTFFTPDLFYLSVIRLLYGAEQHRGQPCGTDTNRIGKLDYPFVFHLCPHQYHLILRLPYPLHSQPVMSFDEFGDPIALTGVERDLYETDTAFAGTTTATITKPSRTWGEWVQYKMTAPFESTLTAVGVSYWIANMLSSGINSRVSITCLHSFQYY